MLFRSGVGNVIPLKADHAVCALQQVDDGPAQGGLAAAGFPHQAQRLTLFNGKGHIIHLLESTDGVIRFEGEDVTHPSKQRMRKLREDMQIIFQDPYSSLNPRLTIQDTIMEPLKLSGRFKADALAKEADRLMDLAGIEKRFRMSYPHELDGGRRQRVEIGRAHV